MTPIEAGAEAVHNWAPYLAARECQETARDVFGSIDRDELARRVLGYDHSELHAPTRRDELDLEISYRTADAILAWLNGGNS